MTDAAGKRKKEREQTDARPTPPRTSSYPSTATSSSPWTSPEAPEEPRDAPGRYKQVKKPEKQPLLSPGCSILVIVSMDSLPDGLLPKDKEDLVEDLAGEAEGSGGAVYPELVRL